MDVESIFQFIPFNVRWACSNHDISILSEKNETAEFNIVDSMYYLTSYEIIHDDTVVQKLKDKYGFINYEQSSETTRLAHIKKVVESIQQSFTYVSDNGAPLTSWTNGIEGLLSDDASFQGDCEDLTLPFWKF